MDYFKEEDLINIELLIKDNLNFYAHIDSNRKETLQEHIDRCNKYFFKIDKSKNIGFIFKNFEDLYLENTDKSSKLLFRKLVLNTINFHDIGKINPKFQSDKMNNKILNKEVFEGLGTKHSIISSIFYLDYFIEEIEKYKDIDKSIFKKLSHILF